MKSSALTPEESLLLITKTIEETKERFKENGHVFVFWGTLMLIVIGSQFILSILELYKFTMVSGFLISGWSNNYRHLCQERIQKEQCA